MAMTNADRQRRWRKKQQKSFRGTGKEYLTMRRIYKYVDSQPYLTVTATSLYRALSAHRDKAKWKILINEIYHNQTVDDSEGPVTCRGTGRRGDPITIITSDNWDYTRDWDREYQNDKDDEINKAAEAKEKSETPKREFKIF